MSDAPQPRRSAPEAMASIVWCVLIPARNEASAIGAVVAPLARQGVDVLVIDDGSSDQTAQAARAAGARVLPRTRDHGKGAALREGFAWALERGYEAVVTMDADGQHAPEDVPRLVQTAVVTGAMIVVGNRMEHPVGMPRVRRWTNRVMSWIVSRLARQRIPDSQCGLRLIHTGLLRRARLEAAHYEIESELLLEAARLGGRIAAAPIQSIYAAQRSQINPWIDTTRFVRFLWRYYRR